MANTITITSIDYANTAIAGQTWTIEYKLFSASSYILGSNNKVVDDDGNLAVPLVISGLTPGQLYYIRSHNNCDSPPVFYTQSIQL